MHIIVPIKQVPESEELRHDPATRTAARGGGLINPFDKRALTEAVRLRSLYGGTITAITMAGRRREPRLWRPGACGPRRPISDSAFGVRST